MYRRDRVWHKERINERQTRIDANVNYNGRFSNFIGLGAMAILHSVVCIIMLIVLNGCAGVLAMKENNDYFSSFVSPSDNNYTQGLAFENTVPTEEANPVLRETAGRLPVFSFGEPVKEEPGTLKFEVGQEIYTPYDQHVKEYLPNEQPYAGWLYAKLGHEDFSENRKLSTNLYFGVVGPWALGKQTQNGFHYLINNKPWEGWDNQLPNEPAFYINHKRDFIDSRGKYTMFLTEVEGNLGTVHTDLSLAKEARLGWNIQPFNLENKRFSIYAFAKPEITAVARNEFYDGTFFRDSHRVTKEPVIGSVDVGLNVEYYGWQIRYHFLTSTKDYDEQESTVHSFAGITIEKIF